LSCGDSQLTSLDVSKCPALEYLSCGGNQLTASALNALFMSLPNRTGEDSSGFIDITNNPGSTTCTRAIAKNKGWGFMTDY
jgi:Leucine-rich repeat (LRR) protein